jgi:hypothetical protein
MMPCGCRCLVCANTKGKLHERGRNCKNVNDSVGDFGKRIWPWRLSLASATVVQDKIVQVNLARYKYLLSIHRIDIDFY